jgi:hypothetical protein
MSCKYRRVREKRDFQNGEPIKWVEEKAFSMDFECVARRRLAAPVKYNRDETGPID